MVALRRLTIALGVVVSFLCAVHCRPARAAGGTITVTLHARGDAYERGEDDSDCRPLTLREVTISASPSELRAIARFVSRCADEMEEYGPRWEHEHLRDDWSEWTKSDADVIVFNVQKQQPNQ